MITYNPDGSGVITVNDSVRAFPAGITPGDLFAMQAAHVAANAPPAAPQAINLTVTAPPVTVNAPNVTAMQASIATIQTNVAALQAKAGL